MQITIKNAKVEATIRIITFPFIMSLVLRKMNPQSGFNPEGPPSGANSFCGVWEVRRGGINPRAWQADGTVAADMEPGADGKSCEQRVGCIVEESGPDPVRTNVQIVVKCTIAVLCQI